jgi:hypothetical protein
LSLPPRPQPMNSANKMFKRKKWRFNFMKIQTNLETKKNQTQCS